MQISLLLSIWLQTASEGIFRLHQAHFICISAFPVLFEWAIALSILDFETQNLERFNS